MDIMEKDFASRIDRQVPVQKIARLIDKYLAILEAPRIPHPEIKLKNNIAAETLGKLRHTIPHDPSQSQTRVMEIQRAVMDDLKTLERVVAHETIHLVDSYEYTPQQLSLIRIGVKPTAHGESFMTKARKINAVAGENFVTKVSDTEYQYAPNQKKFFALISTSYAGRIAWAWAVRISPKALPWVKEQIAKGAKLVESTDDRLTVGTKIKRFGGMSLPRDPNGDTARFLLHLYETGKSVSIP